MAAPIIRPKTKAAPSSLPKKKKISIDRKVAEEIDSCNRKHQLIKKHLKTKHPEDVIDFELQADIDKAIMSVVGKYNKALDGMLENYQIKLDDKKQTSEPEVDLPVGIDLKAAKRSSKSLYGTYIQFHLSNEDPETITQANRVVDAIHEKMMIADIPCEPVILTNGLNDLHGDWGNYSKRSKVKKWIEELTAEELTTNDIFEQEPA